MQRDRSCGHKPLNGALGSAIYFYSIAAISSAPSEQAGMVKPRVMKPRDGEAVPFVPPPTRGSVVPLSVLAAKHSDQRPTIGKVGIAATVTAGFRRSDAGDFVG